MRREESVSLCFFLSEILNWIMQIDDMTKFESALLTVVHNFINMSSLSKRSTPPLNIFSG